MLVPRLLLIARLLEVVARRADVAEAVAIFADAAEAVAIFANVTEVIARMVCREDC